MKFMPCLTLSAVALVALPAIAEDARQLDAHEHGHGALNIALEGNQVAIELEAPGFDIVGFEYAAESDEDKALVEAGLKILSDPTNLFVLPDAAGCSVTEAKAELHGEEEHHGDDHGHEDHAEEAGEDAHSEFHAEYLMSCADVTRLTRIELAYFSQFENAEELEVQLVTETGAASLEASPDNTVLDLAGAM
ncbi:MAG: DUF2796 domain-containing protein [Pseudomonadota bacterium]